MDDAERRFRDCVDRFKRDLTTIIFQSIDSMVLEAEQRAADQASSSAPDADLPTVGRNGSARAKRGKASQRGVQKSKGRSRSDGTAAMQLELDLEIAKVLPSAKPKPARVRADSILGAELADGLDAASAIAAPVFADGDASANGTSVRADVTNGDGTATQVSAASTARFRPSSKPPSERPLFVHRRARDGQIHALRRVRDAAPAAVEGNASGSADPGR